MDAAAPQVATLSSALCIAGEPGCVRPSSAYLLCALETYSRQVRLTAVPNARLSLHNLSCATPGALLLLLSAARTAPRWWYGALTSYVNDRLVIPGRISVTPEIIFFG